MAALSPIVVGYGQEVRAYIFVMLFAAIAVASVATIWLHYTGLLVILPLAVFVWTSRELGRATRRGYVVACAVAFLIVAPLMVIQLRAGHQGGVAPFA